eukprot:m.660985 g.660985  ORF g.660985 m.660985 type:complete len:435 (+) comp58458_c0_seq15:2154-3458(+)
MPTAADLLPESEKAEFLAKQQAAVEIEQAKLAQEQAEQETTRQREHETWMATRHKPLKLAGMTAKPPPGTFSVNSSSDASGKGSKHRRRVIPKQESVHEQLTLEQLLDASFAAVADLAEPVSMQADNLDQSAQHAAAPRDNTISSPGPRKLKTMVPNTALIDWGEVEDEHFGAAWERNGAHEHQDLPQIIQETLQKPQVASASEGEEKQDLRPRGMLEEARTLRLLSELWEAPDVSREEFRAVFDAHDVHQRQSLTPSHLFKAVQAISKQKLAISEYNYILLVLDLVQVQRGGDRLRVMFSSVPFEQFLIIAGLTKSVLSSDAALRKQIQRLDLRTTASELNGAKQIFEVYQHESGCSTMPLDLLSLELKAADYPQRQQDAILDHLRQSGCEPMTLMNFLTYLPLFMRIHTIIINDPFIGTFPQQHASTSANWM